MARAAVVAIAVAVLAHFGLSLYVAHARSRLQIVMDEYSEKTRLVRSFIARANRTEYPPEGPVTPGPTSLTRLAEIVGVDLGEFVHTKPNEYSVRIVELATTGSAGTVVHLNAQLGGTFTRPAWGMAASPYQTSPYWDYARAPWMNWTRSGINTVLALGLALFIAASLLHRRSQRRLPSFARPVKAPSV